MKRPSFVHLSMKPGTVVGGDGHTCGVCGGPSPHARTVNGVVWCSDACWTRLMIGEDPRPVTGADAALPPDMRHCTHCHAAGATWRDDDGWWFCGQECYDRAAGVEEK